jgi:hypothetical protein
MIILWTVCGCVLLLAAYLLGYVRGLNKAYDNSMKIIEETAKAIRNPKK